MTGLAENRQEETVFVQLLPIKHVSPCIMMKDFDVPPVLTQKDENVPCGGLFAHNLAYQFGKGENTFSHIYRTFAQVEAHAGIQP
jgi:hypothetical protein